MPTTIPIAATDADADPLTFAIAQQGVNGTAAVPDPNKPQFLYTGTTIGSDQVKILIGDGISQTTATATLQVVNTPPMIACPPLATAVDTPLRITAADCVTDANGDPVSLDASAPIHGRIQRGDGVIIFTPDKGFAGTAQVTLTATDGIDAANPLTVTIQVGSPDEKLVTIVGDTARAAFTDRPITLRANVSGADPSKINWSFDGKGTVTDQGATVAHLFSKPGHYTVTASMGEGAGAASVRVFVQRPLLSIKRTDLGKDGTMGVRLKMTRSGKLAVTLRGVHSAPHKPWKLKSGTHTIHLKLPASVRERGTVVVKLTLTAPGGGDTVRRAVLLPSP